MKQVILVREDLKMPPGKLSAQVSHASVEAVLKSSKNKIDKWKKEGMKKIVLKVDSLEELKKLENEAKKLKLVTSVIKDLGLTFFKKPTITCLAIGPDEEEKIDRVTGKLKAL